MTTPAQVNAPKVGLIPSPFFFVRVLDVEPGSAAATVAEQVSLAVENWAPFPLAQVFFGYCWRPGRKRAVVYAAYRRRIADEVQESWTDSEWVAPEFAPLLVYPGEAGQTLVHTSEAGVAVLHWNESGELPGRIVTRAFPEEADEATRAAIAEEVIKSLGGTRQLLESAEIPVLTGEPGASSWTLTMGEQTLTLSRPELEAMDIRDREALSIIRKSRAREFLLWRVFVLSLWAIVAALLAQAAFYGGTRWERTREQRLAKRAPEIEAINRANELATRIDELATRRLRPFEMIDAVRSGKPATVVFRSVMTQKAGELEINATTTQAADLPAYRSALAANPKVERAEFLDQNSRDRVTTFRLLVTFKPGAFEQEAKP